MNAIMKKWHFVFLSILPLTACNPEEASTDWTTSHVGTYTGTTVCDGEPLEQHFITLSRNSDVEMVSEIAGMVLQMQNENDFLIPPQMIWGVEYEGGGSFNGDNMIFSYSRDNQGPPIVDCTFNGNR